MKTCMVCGIEKSLDQFTMRRRPPIRPYAACKDCEPMAYRKKPLNTEYQSLRDKAVSLRKLTPEQGLEALKRYSAGETQKAIAADFGVSGDCVSRTIKRVRREVDKH